MTWKCHDHEDHRGTANASVVSLHTTGFRTRGFVTSAMVLVFVKNVVEDLAPDGREQVLRRYGATRRSYWGCHAD